MHTGPHHPLAAIANAEAVEPSISVHGNIGYGDMPRRSLSRAQVVEVIKGEIIECADGVERYQLVDRHQEAEALRSEIEVPCDYLEPT